MSSWPASVSPPRIVQFSLTPDEFEAVSSAAARAGPARGAYAAEVTLAAACDAQSREPSPLREALADLMSERIELPPAGVALRGPRRARGPAALRRGMGAGRCRHHGPDWPGTGRDDLAVRWGAVRLAPEHIHLVATLARQDRIRPKAWNDYFRVREACQDAERHFGLRSAAPADRIAARRPNSDVELLIRCVPEGTLWLLAGCSRPRAGVWGRTV